MGVRLIDPGNIVHASASKPIAMLTLTKPSAVMFTLSETGPNAILPVTSCRAGSMMLTVPPTSADTQSSEPSGLNSDS